MTSPETAGDAAPVTRLRNGKTAAERRSDRRQLLVDNAFEIIDSEGSAAVTVRELCRRTGLTARYFYESFDSRDDMLRELFDGVADDFVGAVAAAMTRARKNSDDVARAIIETFVERMADDRPKARLLLYEPLVEAALSGGGPARTTGVARMIRDELPSDLDRTERALIALDLVGVLATVLSSWLTGSVRASRTEIVEYLVRRFHQCGIGSP